MNARFFARWLTVGVAIVGTITTVNTLALAQAGPIIVHGGIHHSSVVAATPTPNPGSPTRLLPGLMLRDTYSSPGDSNDYWFHANAGCQYQVLVDGRMGTSSSWLSAFDARGIQIFGPQSECPSLGQDQVNCFDYTAGANSSNIFLQCTIRNGNPGPGSEYHVILYESCLATPTPAPTFIAIPTRTPTATPCISADSFEPDGSIGSSKTIPVGVTIPSEHFFCDPGDQDYMKFTGQANRTYTISTYHLGPDCDTLLTYWGTQNQAAGLINDNCTPADLSSCLTVTAPAVFGSGQASGFLYFSMENISGRSGYGTSYKVYIEELSTSPTVCQDYDRVEIAPGNDSIAALDAKDRISPGLAFTRKHYFCDPGDIDYTWFQSSPGNTHYLYYDATIGVATLALSAFDSTGTRIFGPQASCPVLGNPQVNCFEYPAPNSQVVFMLAEYLSGPTGRAGDYNISMVLATFTPTPMPARTPTPTPAPVP